MRIESRSVKILGLFEFTESESTKESGVVLTGLELDDFDLGRFCELTKTELERGLSKALPMVIAMDHSPDQSRGPARFYVDSTASDQLTLSFDTPVIIFNLLIEIIQEI